MAWTTLNPNNPARPASRHGTMLALAGWLLRAGWSIDAIKELIEDVIFIAGDPDGVRPDYLQAVDDTAQKLADGDPTTGYPTLVNIFGEDALTAVAGQLSIGGGTSDRSRIVVSGDLADMTDRSWKALVAANNEDPIHFLYGTEIVRLARDTFGAVQLMVLTEDGLRYEMARCAEFVKVNRNGIAEPCFPPRDVIRDMLADPNKPLPHLKQLTDVPVFAVDGSLTTEPGYDSLNLTYLTTSDWLPIPDRPTAEDLARAVHLIVDEVFGDFPLVGDSARAHLMAMLLLPFVRGIIDGPTPLHLINKPEVGTGASLIADAISIIATGRSAEATTMWSSEEEGRKRLTALMLEGRTIIVLDNLPPKFESGTLSAALTAPVWRDRILGHSKTGGWPILAVFIGTGNNVEPSKELARRTVTIQLDAGMEFPFLRNPQQFRHPNLREYVRQHRRELVWACHVIVQNWVAQGRLLGSPSLGSYESWAQVVGGILAAAGVEGFLDRIEEQAYAAATSNDDRPLVRTWYAEFGTQPIGARQLAEMIIAYEVEMPFAVDPERSAKVSRQVGYYLRRLKDRTFDLEPGTLSVVVRFVGEHRNANQYRLEVRRHDGAPADDVTSVTSRLDDIALVTAQNGDEQREGDKWDKRDTSPNHASGPSKAGSDPALHQHAETNGVDASQSTSDLIVLIEQLPEKCPPCHTCPQAPLGNENAGDKPPKAVPHLSPLSPDSPEITLTISPWSASPDDRDTHHPDGTSDGHHFPFGPKRLASNGQLTIFATGFPNQRAKTDPTHPTLRQSDIFKHFIDVAERELGYTVIRGGWDLGDPIPEADLYIVDTLNPESRGTNKHTLSMFDLMSRGVPILFVHSDWMMSKARTNFRRFINHPNLVITKTESGFFRNRDNSLIDVQLVHDRLDPMRGAIHDYITGWRSHWATTIPMLPFGNREKLMKYLPGARPGRLFTYDPSSVVDRLTPEPSATDAPRNREWIVASLTKPGKWLDSQPLGWSIRGFGNWAKNRVPEDLVIQAHRECWGSISVPHSGHAGSGWQRARYVIAAKLGAVTLMDLRDRDLFGPPYQHSALAYERMTDADLTRLARDQCDWLTANIASYETFVEQVERAITNAVSESVTMGA